MKNFIKQVNKTRLENKNKWYFINTTINNKQIQIKGYNTWLQIYNVNGINYSNSMDESIKQFKESLAKPFNN